MSQRSAPLLLVKLRIGDSKTSEYRVVTEQVISFKYKDRERKSDLCSLEVENYNLENFDDPVWKKGGHLIVQWGYPGNMSPAREVVITSVKGFTTLSIEAESKSVLMNRVTKSRVFKNKSVTEVVESIAKENGYDGDSLHIDHIQTRKDSVSQARLTDAQFIRRWAARLGYEFFVDFDGFHFHKRRLGDRPVRTFWYFSDPDRGDLTNVNIENDITAKPGKVTVKGRDPINKNDISESADNDSDKDRDSLAPFIELVDLDTKRSTLQALESEDVVPTTDATSSDAKERAKGRYRRSLQTAVEMTCDIVGDPQMLAKTVVKVEGMGKRLSIRYYVKEVEHDLSPSGYICNLTMISDGHGGHSTKSTSASGLDLVTGRGPGSGKSISDEVLQKLQAALAAAKSEGDTDRASAIEKTITAYKKSGNRARADVTKQLKSVLKDPNASEEVKRLTAQVASSLNRRGSETETGGKLNTQEALDQDSGELQSYEAVDLDTKRSVLRWRQTPGRGKNGE